MRIILPKMLHVPDPMYGPFFFMIGPVRGGNDWQSKGCIKIAGQLPAFYAALPCRKISEVLQSQVVRQGEENGFPRQLFWERHYIDYAAKKAPKGCVLCWLPCESITAPRDDGEPYARDTRGELGELRGRMMHEPLRVVIGGEKNFSGLDQIRADFCKALNVDFPIYSTLEETIKAAIQMVR